ncbi:Uncharacterized protein APZ42_012773 [Daphnia magna]|uniref:Uncharacterized protein n=1 Tax=Daphnia magna TaxID=35525 RepID=A0A162RHN5_9CRUS|nr:Uncharacterized protein APZ42_012773 [Daphnia magna]
METSTPQTRIFEVPSGVNYCFPVTETSDVPTLGFSPILPVKKVELPTSAAIIQSTLFDVAFPPTEPRPDQSFICSHRDNFERLNSDPLFSGSSQSLQCVNHNPYTGKPLHKHVPQTVTGGDPSQHSLGAVCGTNKMYISGKQLNRHFLSTGDLSVSSGNCNWPTRRDKVIIYLSASSIGGSDQFTEDSFSENSTVNSTTEEYSGEEESILSNVNIDTKKPVSTDRSSKSYPDSKDNNKQQPKQKEANRTSSAIYRLVLQQVIYKTQANQQTNSHTSQHEQYSSSEHQQLFDRWIKLFENVVEMSNWNEDEKINMLIPKISDTANEIMQNILDSNTQDYEEIKAEKALSDCDPIERQGVKKKKWIINFKMLDEDIVELSTSAWAAPVVLVEKKDGTQQN